VRDLLRHRAALVAMCTALKNRVHALLARHGIHHQHADLFGKAGRGFLAEVELRDPPRRRLDSLLSLVEDFDREITSTSREMGRSAASNLPARPRHESLGHRMSPSAAALDHAPRAGGPCTCSGELVSMSGLAT
jgi:transposase